MTFDTLKKIIKDNRIPSDVHLISDSGWECSATEMDGVYYNESENTIVFTQYSYKCNGYYDKSDKWKNLSRRKNHETNA